MKSTFQDNIEYDTLTDVEKYAELKKSSSISVPQPKPDKYKTVARAQPETLLVPRVLIQGTFPGMWFSLSWIPPGEFMMGSPENEHGRDDNETQYKVRLTKGFYMQTTEVTQGQWKAVMGSNPSYFQNCGDDCPVEMVSWYDVQEFIKKIAEKESILYRLPTEAEWEYAARAGTTGAYSGNLDTMGWYLANSDMKTHPVAQKQPNAWGLYDMGGNVWEWCQDWYGDYPYDVGTDPGGASSGSYRVIRGGSWDYLDINLRSADRSMDVPSDRNSYSLGFRLVLQQ